MIINGIDDSVVSEYTNRTFLLNKASHAIQQPLANKQETFQVIRDKSICQHIEKDESIQSSLVVLYSKTNMIRPENLFIIVWNIILILIIIFYLLQVPLILGFGQVVWRDISYGLLPLLIVFFVILTVDILITPLKTCYKEGLLIKDRRVLLKEYLRFNFWIDIVGLVAIVIPVIFRQYYAVNIIKILFIPKILIINQLNDKIVGVLVFRVKAKTIYLLGRLIIFMIFIAHYIGIGFYMVGYYIYQTNYYGPNTPNICWLYSAQAYSQIVLLLDWKGQYLYTMYFSIGVTTTIAYGDITPLNPIETLYIIFALVINTLAFGYILSQILRILIQAFYAQFDQNNIKYTMQGILVSRKIKPKLRQLIRAHMEQISKQEIYRDRKIQRQVISSLPFNLQIGLYGKIYGQFIQNLKISPEPFYTDKNRNSRFVQKMLLQITQSRYLVGDLIYKENEIYTEQFNNHKTYFLKDKTKMSDIIIGVGKSPNINLENNQIQEQHQYKLFLNDRPFFGNVQFLTGGKRSHWIMSKNNILLYQLPRKSFLKNLRFASRKQLEYLTQWRQKIQDSYCYICYEGHNFQKCAKTIYIPNVSQSVVKFNEKWKMKRKHNFKIEDIRSQKRIISTKTNALRNFKAWVNAKDKKALQKSKIRLLAHSKHYRRVLREDTSSQSSSCGSSSASSQDLDLLINETKTLIQNLNKVENKDQLQQDASFYVYDFDSYYHFQGYKLNDNYENVLIKLSDIQGISMPKTKENGNGNGNSRKF